MTLAKHVSVKNTPQAEEIPGKGQIKNNAGGYVFGVSDTQRLLRFLILGSEGGTYYVGERELTRDNCKALARALDADPLEAIRLIVEVSDSGRAPKNDYAVFALAYAASHKSEDVRKYALSQLNKVCRIPTHLFQFAAACDELRGWGKGLRKAIGNWYLSREPKSVAYHVLKYGQRNGWSHSDLLRLSHQKPSTEEMSAVFDWIAHRDEMRASRTGEAFDLVGAYEEAQKTEDERTLITLIERHNLSREMIPNTWLKSPNVWEALLPKMGTTALLRNLNRLTVSGLLTAGSKAVREVSDRLNDVERLRKDRIHPVAVLMALRQYRLGHGLLGNLTWSPVAKVSDALESAFMLSFKTVEPSGKSMLLALDVSGSMGCRLGDTGLTCAEGAAVMAMATARVEGNYEIMAFSDVFKPIDISASDSLQSVLEKTSNQNFGATDCSLPFSWARKHGHRFDLFAVYTDNETWAGVRHPVQELASYRNKYGSHVKSVVVGMTATEFTINDPADVNAMDVVGFDANTPAAISEFAKL